MLRNLHPFGTQKEAPPELIVVSYPGIIKNVDRAIETLGGMLSLNQAYFGNRPLEMRHTPENPFTSCLVAERVNENKVTSGRVHIAIKVRRKKSDPSVVETQCLGTIGTVFKFESLCDFQYLPVRKRPDGDVYEDLIPKLIPMDLPSALCWWDRPDTRPDETPLFLPPYQFSRYTTPSTKILCRETVEKMKRKMLGHGQNLRLERKALTINVHATDEFPTAPTEEAKMDADFRCKNPEPRKLLEELFNERPMWTRLGVSFKTRLDETVLKSLLQIYAFYISNGPWGRLWCRFGYDPRKDCKAVEYQTLMVSFRQHTKIPERQRLKVSSSDRQKNNDDVLAVGSVHFAYLPGQLPKVRQMWYCLCDINIPAAQDLLRKNATTEYNAQYGFVTAPTLDLLRDMVKDDVRRTSTEMDVEQEDDVEINMDDEWR